MRCHWTIHSPTRMNPIFGCTRQSIVQRKHCFWLLSLCLRKNNERRIKSGKLRDDKWRKLVKTILFYSIWHSVIISTEHCGDDGSTFFRLSVRRWSMQSHLIEETVNMAGCQSNKQSGTFAWTLPSLRRKKKKERTVFDERRMLSFSRFLSIHPFIHPCLLASHFQSFVSWPGKVANEKYRYKQVRKKLPQSESQWWQDRRGTGACCTCFLTHHRV